MPSILTNLAKVSAARDLIKSFNSKDVSPHYIGIGGILSWPSDPTPLPITNCDLTINDVWRDSYAMKRISTVDACLVTLRYTWTSGTIYDQYTDRGDLTGKHYYVVNSSNDVFKCLNNNYGVASTIEPTQSNSHAALNDGYIWRWMYNISSELDAKFSTSEFMPVVDVPNSPVAGQVTRIDLTNVGTGYQNANITIEGDGIGAAATITTSNGHIGVIAVTSFGTGYNYAKAIITGDGVNASADVILSPRGGHAYSPAEELNACFVMISVDLEFDEGGKFLTNNEYRKVFLVREPIASDGTLLSTSSAKTTTDVILTSTSTFTQDQEVQIWLNSVKVGTANVAFNDTVNNTLHLCNVTAPSITANHKIFDGFSQINITTVSNSDVIIYSGKVLYALYRTPIFRHITQSERIKIPLLW